MALFSGGADQELRVTIKAKDEATQTIAKVQGSVGAMAKGFAIGTVAVQSITAGFRAMSGIVTRSMQEFEEHNTVVAQMQAVLKSTNYAAGITSAELTKMADALSKVTLYEDDAIMATQNMLLTFTNITKGIFPETTAAVLDMSAALGQDLKSSAIQLGKALNNPIEGVSALQRVGVSFNNAQQEMIETMVKGGRTLEAQRFILAEIQKEFGGVAESAYQSASSITKLQKNISELEESIGSGLTPALNNMFGAFQDVTAGMGKNADVGKVVFMTVSKIGETAIAAAAGIHYLAGSVVNASATVAKFASNVTGLSKLMGVFGIDSNKFIDDFKGATTEGMTRTASLYDMVKARNNEVSRSWGQTIESARTLKTVGPAAYVATAKEAEAAAKKVKEFQNVTNDAVTSLQKLKNGLLSDDQAAARAFAEQEQKIEGLRKDLSGEDDPERQAELRSQIAKESAALEGARPQFRGALSETLNAERKRADSTEFERTMSDIAGRKSERISSELGQIVIDLRNSTVAGNDGIKLLASEIQKILDRKAALQNTGV